MERAALYSAQAVELLLPRMGPDQARQRAAELLQRAPRGQRLVCGIATYPSSGETADQLLARIKQEREARYDQQFEEWEAAVKAWEVEGKPGRKPTKPRKPQLPPPSLLSNF